MAKAKKQSAVKIPAGYKVCPTAGSTSAVDWDKTPVVEGTVIEIKDVTVTDKKTKKKNDTRLMVVETKEGEEVAVWEKFQLETLFNSVEAGDKVYIAHTGVKRIPGGKTLHEFVTAFK
jgi:hypothetical protein